MKELIKTIEVLKMGKVRKIVDARIKEFEKAGKKPSREIFKELCFCILTANFNAERAIDIQKKVGDGFLTLPEKSLAKKLKLLGYRYPNTRAKYIVGARKHSGILREILASFEDECELRDWFVNNVKGLGCKEASHFLRNIGYKDCAIIDFHIVDVLEKNSIVQRPKTMTKRCYLGLEDQIRKLAEKLNLTLAELDLYLWYLETGKILK
ncbi:N-glycosylase/DNA lyase [Candidatus Altiarchaeota archaeon]